MQSSMASGKPLQMLQVLIVKSKTRTVGEHFHGQS